jgi:hypothetical protein
VNHIKGIGEKIQGLLIQTARNSTQCLISLDCITRLAYGVVSIISDISDEVASEAANLQSLDKDVLPELANTVSSFVQSAQSQAADIAQDTVRCINDKISAADSTPSA